MNTVLMKLNISHVCRCMLRTVQLARLANSSSELCLTTCSAIEQSIHLYYCGLGAGVTNGCYQ